MSPLKQLESRVYPSWDQVLQPYKVIFLYLHGGHFIMWDNLGNYGRIMTDSARTIIILRTRFWEEEL